MKQLISALLIILGLGLAAFSVIQGAATLLPAFLPTATPEEVVIEEYAPEAPTAAPLAATPEAGGVLDSAEDAFLGQPIDAAPALAPSLVPAAPTQEAPDSPQPPAEPLPSPTAEPTAEPAIPTRIVIPAIALDAPVELAASRKVKVGSGIYYQWTAPNKFAAGWHTSSAPLGLAGNTVLSGHNNVYGKVFGKLEQLNPGDVIEMYSGERLYRFVIANKMILPEKGRPIAERLENARWIGQSEDVRLTLITCWPEKSNTHRLIIVAVPES